MSLRDDLGALPGGAAVVSVLDQLTAIDTNTLADLAGRWQRAAAQSTAASTAVNNAIGQVDGQWSGAQASAVTDYADRWASAGSTLSGALTQAADLLEQAETAISGTQSWAASRCEWLLVEARTRQASAVSGLCQQTAAELGQLVSTVNAELSTLATGLAQLSGQEQPFDAIDPPAGMSMTVVYSNPVYSRSPYTAGRGTLPGNTLSGSRQSTLAQPFGNRRAVPAGGTAMIPGRKLARLTPTAATPARSETIPAHANLVTESSGGQSAPAGQVGDWITQALAVLRANGVDTSQINPNDLYTIIEHESAGNPDAVNNWDDNAAAGHPSKGLMQTIDSTFNAYKLPGHDDIFNPVDNIIAGVRYALARYGSIGSVPGVAAVARDAGYVGY